MPVEPARSPSSSAYLVFDARATDHAHRTFGVSGAPGRCRARACSSSRASGAGQLDQGHDRQSGNDAAVALAEGVAGSVERFMELMNQQAKALSMRPPTGNVEGLTAQTTPPPRATWPPGHAPDDFPVRRLLLHQRYRYPGTPAANDTNRNLLLFRDPTVDGLKTSHRRGGLLPWWPPRTPAVPGLGDSRPASQHSAWCR